MDPPNRVTKDVSARKKDKAGTTAQSAADKMSARKERMYAIMTASHKTLIKNLEERHKQEQADLLAHQQHQMASMKTSHEDEVQDFPRGYDRDPISYFEKYEERPALMAPKPPTEQAQPKQAKDGKKEDMKEDTKHCPHPQRRMVVKPICCDCGQKPWEVVAYELVLTSCGHVFCGDCIQDKDDYSVKGDEVGNCNECGAQCDVERTLQAPSRPRARPEPASPRYY